MESLFDSFYCDGREFGGRGFLSSSDSYRSGLTMREPTYAPSHPPSYPSVGGLRDCNLDLTQTMFMTDITAAAPSPVFSYSERDEAASRVDASINLVNKSGITNRFINGCDVDSQISVAINEYTSHAGEVSHSDFFLGDYGEQVCFFYSYYWFLFIYVFISMRTSELFCITSSPTSPPLTDCLLPTNYIQYLFSTL